MSIIIGGTIAIDNVSTPTAKAENLLGGSAAYASLSASYFCKPAHLVGVVGTRLPRTSPQHAGGPRSFTRRCGEI